VIDPESVVIAPEKLRDYILSSTHADGRAKAAYLARLGYGPHAWERLAADLRDHVGTGALRPGRPSPYGLKYEILGPLTGPNGRTAWVRTVWMVLHGEAAARFITLVPEERP
jgi:hypothetical protein